MKIPGYRIKQTIGEGGMATAYLGVQESLGRLVVLKILNTSNSDSPQNVERFLNEGRLVATLNHPHIITIYDIGIAEEFAYISMEYVEGGDLRQRLKQIIPPIEALSIITKIGTGLSAAHKKGIIHRDVKPDNILFRTNGEPLLTDFGIAKQLTIDHDLTSTGIFLGSPSYVAPEQAQDGPIDERVDIYSLGIIFYEMLTGSKPYSSDSVIDLILQHKQAPIPYLPPALALYQQLLNLMVAKNRKDRFRDADSMLHYMHHMQTATAINSAPDTTSTSNRIAINDAHPTSQTQELQIDQNKTPPVKDVRILLAILLSLSVMGYGVRYYLDSAIGTSHTVAQTPAPTHNSPPPFPFLTAPVGPLPETSKSSPPETPTTQEVVNALTWLARHSLEEYRFTYPPKDNAYYYYSRLLEIDPKSETAREGLLLVADRFAYLAEQELAANNYEAAQNYIAKGLKIDPHNQTLIKLQALTESARRRFFDSVRNFLQGR